MAYSRIYICLNDQKCALLLAVSNRLEWHMHPSKKPISTHRVRQWITMCLLAFLLVGLFYIPYLTYSIWRHQHRMHFKSEAAKMYHDRPELFATFQCDDNFNRTIEMLKPGKEFRLEGKKYDIIDTLSIGGEKHWVCIQDEYEMALERLIERHGEEDQNNTAEQLAQDWKNIFRSQPQPQVEFDAVRAQPDKPHPTYWTCIYTAPYLHGSRKPPQS